MKTAAVISIRFVAGDRRGLGRRRDVADWVLPGRAACGR
jgi:hypothetical protein